MLDTYLDLELVDIARSGGADSAAVSLAAAFAPALIERGRGPEAMELLRRASATLQEQAAPAFEIATIALFAPDLARGFRAPLVAFAAQDGDRVNRALLALVDAAVARQDNDLDAARERAIAAAHGFGAIGWPLVEAACLEIAGDVAGALSIYRRCGATGPERRLHRPRDADVPAALQVLTPRERELALRVAAGDGNRAAARALSVTEKAVEKYLTVIYRKLGVASRSQLTARVAGTRVDAQHVEARV